MIEFVSTRYMDGRIITQTEDDEYVTVGKHPVVDFEYSTYNWQTWDCYRWHICGRQYERSQRVNKTTGMVDHYFCGEYDLR